MPTTWPSSGTRGPAGRAQVNVSTGEVGGVANAAPRHPVRHDGLMAKYLISFPSATMVIAPEHFADVVETAHEVVREAKAAGVYVFGGGIDESVAPVLVQADGSITAETSHLDGGFCVLELPTREDAERWAARIATACRTPQELRTFQDDPES